MKIISAISILAAAAVSFAAIPHLHALPYIGLQMPETPPSPPTPPTPPAVPAMASIDVVPEPPEPPDPPAPPESWYDGDDDNKYVLSAGDMNVVNGNGDTDISGLRRSYGRHFFWFRHDGRDYVVRDAATIDALVELYRPQSELGREQGELGRRQGDLGRKQGELGRRQGELGREQGRLGMQQARLAIRFDDDDDPGIKARRREIENRQRELSRKQEGLGREQGELSREQAKSGAGQSRLGDRQTALSRDIENKLRPMLEQMIRKGIAEKVR